MDEADVDLKKDAEVKARFEMSREFQFLRPRCINVLKNPSPVHLQALKMAVKEIPKIVPEICDYVLFPLGVHIKVISKYK